MKKLLMIVVALCAAGSVYANSIAAGTKELALSGNLDPDSAFGTEFNLDLKLGYFVQDNIEVGGLLGIQDNDAYTTYGLGGFGEYNFDLESPVSPFAGAALKYLAAEIDDGDDESAVVLTLYGGARYFVSPDVAIFGLAKFEQATEDVYVEDGDLEDTNIGIDIGLSVYIP